MEKLTEGLIGRAPTDEDILVQLIEQYRTKAASKYADKDYLLYRDGVGFSPRGNVMALSAEKKAGKTWFAMAMCAAMLNGQYLGMQSQTENGVVLFFDTEQDEGDSQRIQKRVHYACGWDFETDNDRFYMFHLREIDAKERRKVVCQLIELMKPDMVIVDGIRDLLNDFNDLTESAAVIQEFMRLSSECQCAIWAVLHVNPNSEKMRGHLGTELGNKVADILHMTKHKDVNDEDNVTYKMEEVAARSHKDIHSITFRIDDNQPWGAPVLLTQKQVKVMEANELDELDKDMRIACPDARVMSKTNMRENLKRAKGIGSTKADKRIAEGAKQRIIEPVDTPHGVKYRYVGIKERPNEVQDEMPF